ncbi:MAG TPA: AMP-binding protein [Candidatus Baltobacteraceae bacterium]|jgi:2-furoate---CoA ligase
MDLGTTFCAAVEREPNALAIVDGAIRLTYAQWKERVMRVVSGLQQRGVGRGDRVVTVLRNSEPMATLYWATQLLGATLTPVNWRLSRDELEFIIEDAEPRCVIGEAATSFEELLDGTSATSTDSVSEETYSIMLYTSGTTGRPKGVLRTHRAERAAALAHIAQNHYGRSERTLGVMPLYHTMGIRSLIAMTMLNGRFVAMPRWDPTQALDLLERERITNLYLAPTLFYDLLADSSLEERDLRALRKIGFAGAPMTPVLVERCFATFNPDVFVNHYGSTEIYTFSINDTLRAKPASAGKAGINERLSVIDGEIAVHMSSPEAFSGYWKRPDAQARAIRDGWYHTGDAGKIDEDGDLFVLGRIDDMIISGGENIYPAEVEDAMAHCPAIARIAVIGMPDERLGQKIVAFVEPANGEVKEEHLETYARSCGMTQFKRPREYIFVRAIPQSPSGKILRTKLRAGEYERRGVSLRS